MVCFVLAPRCGRGVSVLRSFITAHVAGCINTVVVNVFRRIEFFGTAVYATIVPMVCFVLAPRCGRGVSVLRSFIIAHVAGCINAVVINVFRHIEFCAALCAIVPVVVSVRRPRFARRVGSDVNFSAARADVPVSCAVRLPSCRSCGVHLEVRLYRHVGCGHCKVGFGCGAVCKGAFARFGPACEVIARRSGDCRKADGFSCLFIEIFGAGALLDRHFGIDLQRLGCKLAAISVGNRFYCESGSGFVCGNGEYAVA